jgi:hypothetical protein
MSHPPLVVFGVLLFSFIAGLKMVHCEWLVVPLDITSANMRVASCVRIVLICG